MFEYLFNVFLGSISYLTWGDRLSWTLSSLSNFSWLFVFIPQILVNYRSKTSNAISFYLLLLWYIGDVFCTVSVLNKKMYVIFYVGVYHLIFDIIILGQVVYYRLPRFSECEMLLSGNGSSYEIVFRDTVLLYLKKIAYMLEVQCFIMFNILFWFVIKFISVDVSNILAWLSTFIFVTSRMPQILLNYRRKSVSGLSFVTFFNVIIANQLFLASILVQLIDMDSSKQITHLITNAPWIVGCFTCSIFDLVIYTQFKYYTNY